MSAGEEGEEKEVTAADQADINEFSKLNIRFHEVEDDIKSKKVDLNKASAGEQVIASTQDQLQNLQDCSNEIMMLLDDSEPVKVPRFARRSSTSMKYLLVVRWRSFC
eukprot:748008-Hanusia_phi.AAC.6